MPPRFISKHTLLHLSSQAKRTARTADEYRPTKSSRKGNEVVYLWNMKGWYMICFVPCETESASLLYKINYRSQHIPRTIPPFQVTNPPNTAKTSMYGMEEGRISATM
ncbi:hypothetical protein C0989_006622 [Termitomyces sp. Mn162]|nr:hypothetical protein C0989_006622 [Termitomyces sp. Mn162]